MTIVIIVYINVLTLCPLLFITIAAIFELFKHRKEEIPNNVPRACPDCNERFSHFLTRKKKTPSYAKDEIKMSLITLTVIGIFNIVAFLSYMIGLPSEIQTSILNGSFISESVDEIRSILIFKFELIAEAAFFVINIFLYAFFGYEKVDTIICVCNNCGAVIEIDSDIKINKEGKEKEEKEVKQ